MDQIADQAALSKATLYNYFTNKEAIFYGIGVRTFKLSTQARQNILKSDLTGLEQVIILSRTLFTASIGNPLNLKILRMFTEKNNQLNITIEEILENLQRSENKEKMIANLEPFKKNMVEFLSQIWQYEKEWHLAIQKGIRDGSIKSNLSPQKITYYIFIIIFGISDQIEQMKIPLKRANFFQDEIINLTIKLIRNVLNNRNTVK